MLFHEFLLTIIGRRFWRRTLSLSIISIISIVFVYSIQYFENKEQFEIFTSGYISSVFSLNTFSILVFLSFVIVDIISFFQTITFSRLAAYCKNVIEVAFLAFSDIIVSFFLVIFILPALIFVSHKIATRQHETTIRFALKDGLQPQTLSVRSALLMAAPRAEGDVADTDEATDGVPMKVSDLSEHGWSYSTPTIFIAPQRGEISIEKIAKGEVAQAGQSVIFEKGQYTAEETSSIIAQILSIPKGVRDVRPIESYRDSFSNSIYSFDINGFASSSNLQFSSHYRYLLRDVNFFGSDLYSLFRFNSKVYSENDIMWLGTLTKGADSATDSVIYKCDEEPVKTAHREDFIAIASKCSKGYAMSEWGASGVASLLSYKFDHPTMVPILPTALSSIFLTFIIYIAIFMWICLPYINELLKKYTDGGAQLLVDNQFKIIYGVIVIAALPLLVT